MPDLPPNNTTKSVSFNKNHLAGFLKARDRHFVEEAKEKRAISALANVPEATFLQAPENEFEQAYYKAMGASCSNNGVYFTTVRPVLRGLETFCVGYQGPKKPEFIIFRPKKFKAAFGWRGLSSSGVKHLRDCGAYVYPLNEIKNMPEFLWEYVIDGAEAYRQ